jgi:hypothetical protein
LPSSLRISVRSAAPRVVRVAAGRGYDGQHDSSSTPMTIEAAARIMSAEAKANGGRIEKGSFAARAMSAAHRNYNAAFYAEYGYYPWQASYYDDSDSDDDDDYDDDD